MACLQNKKAMGSSSLPTAFHNSQVSSLRLQLECWNIGFWENGKLGYCKIPLDGN